MSEPDNAHVLDDLLTDFAALVDSDTLVGNADAFLNEASGLVSDICATGHIPSPADPFKGRTAEPDPDPDLFYTMFWRMFDQTPASMVQSFAIPLRRILAQKIFKHCGEGVIFHHNVLFSKGSNISIGDWSLINRYVMLDDRADIEAMVKKASARLFVEQQIAHKERRILQIIAADGELSGLIEGLTIGSGPAELGPAPPNE